MHLMQVTHVLCVSSYLCYPVVNGILHYGKAHTTRA